jgi:CheY-like chemotaxis protein
MDFQLAELKYLHAGPGIPAEKQDYIFEKFTRLSKAAESKVSGTGLGLAIASEMARLMGGTLTLDPQVARGATFVLKLPFKLSDEVQQPDVEAARPNHDQPLLGRHVLIADDMDFNRYVNKAVLQKMGATVHETSDGKQALIALEAGNFDIAILDINMPEMTGIEVVQSALSDRSILPPKFIALSAHTTAKMQASCLAVGFDHFIEKPLDPTKLEGIIDTPIESESSSEATLDSSLLDYLSGNDPTAAAALEKRYHTSLTDELDQLGQALRESDTEAQRYTIHKLKGLANFKKNAAILNLLDSMAQNIEAEASQEASDTLFQELSIQIEQS